ncbi:MAG TPA: acyltransferase [Methylomirabilota bacterium]
MNARASEHVERGLDRAEAAPVPVLPADSRVNYVDIVRGLFILLMASSHAAGLSEVAESSVFRSHWWLPQGWASEGFIMLSGFTVALLFAPGPSTTRRLLHRARQLLIVMFVSNVLMLAVKSGVTGEWWALTTPGWWLGLLTLHTPYSISIVLLPIAAFLAVAPLLFALSARGPVAVVVTAVGAAAVIAGLGSTAIVARDDHVLDVLWRQPALLPLMSLGALGFAMGTTWRRLRYRRRELVAAVLLWSLACLSLPVMGLPEVHAFTASVPRFGLVLLVGIAIDAWPRAREALWVTSVLGSYGLFAFIAHRIAIQALVRLFAFAPPEVRYLVSFGAGMALVVALCVLRRRVGAWDAFLRTLRL